MALSFVIPKDMWGKNKFVGCLPSAEKDEVVFEKIEQDQRSRIKEYQFDLKQVEAFRYRMEDALRSVTKSVIKEARVKELKAEILNSDKLKVFLVVVFFWVFYLYPLDRHILKTTLWTSNTCDTINPCILPGYSHT